MTSFKIKATPRNKIFKDKEKYPWVGYLKDEPEVVVLFTKEKHGVYLSLGQDTTHNKVGVHYSGFVEDLFLPFNGKITIDCEV